MVGLGVAICSYNILVIRMYIGQTKEVGTKKIKTQHKCGHVKKSDVHGSQATIPNGRCYIKLK